MLLVAGDSELMKFAGHIRAVMTPYKSTCTPAQVYYVRPTCVSRNGIMHAGYSQSFHDEINSRLSDLHPNGGGDDDYFLCVHPSVDVSVYSLDSAGLSDSRWSDHRIPQSSLPPTTCSSIQRFAFLSRPLTLFFTFSSIRDMFSCFFVHNLVVIRAAHRVELHQKKHNHK
ncbi:hypothetical protein QTP88_020159 [Uroleucon formosanum]